MKLSRSPLCLRSGPNGALIIRNHGQAGGDLPRDEGIPKGTIQTGHDLHKPTVTPTESGTRRLLGNDSVIPATQNGSSCSLSYAVVGDSIPFSSWLRHHGPTGSRDYPRQHGKHELSVCPHELSPSCLRRSPQGVWLRGATNIQTQPDREFTIHKGVLLKRNFSL